jgi:hypothetical protein
VEAFSHGMLNCLPLLQKLRTFSALLIIACMLLGLLARLRHPDATICGLEGCVAKRIPLREIVPTGRILLLFLCSSQVPTIVLRSCTSAFLAVGKDCSWSLDG